MTTHDVHTLRACVTIPESKAQTYLKSGVTSQISDAIIHQLVDVFRSRTDLINVNIEHDLNTREMKIYGTLRVIDKNASPSVVEIRTPK